MIPFLIFRIINIIYIPSGCFIRVGIANKKNIISFGDYFKRDAIHWAWEFLTSPEWVGLEADRLYPSVFAGNETTPADDEAFRIWNEEIGIPAERIFKFGKEDNFWEHGSGPCGPCSEIYYDRGPEWGCGKPGCTVGCDCDRYIEVWNIVFSQFDNDGEGHYTELKQKNIDTGMGLERLACVCQNVASLFDVDTVMNITNKVSEITHAHYGETAAKDVSLRVITDHIRSSVFMICDGVLPSNEGRGYVLRRLLRRAARHGKLLGVNEPFLYEVCDTVIHENEGHYPELRERQDYITKVIRTEEENFAKTIDSGLKIFGDMLAGHKAKGESTFSGADAFKLYDTYGFPIDLTLEMVEEQGMKLDEAEFHNQMDEQRQRARKAREAREALGDLGWAGPAWSSARMCPRPSLWAMTTPPLTTPRWWPWWWRTSRPRSSCPAWRPSWCWTRPPSTPRWAARWPTTASSPPTASPSRSPTCRRTRAASICTPAS